MLFILLPAFGSVFVDDPTTCVDPERLENELSLLVGDRSEVLDVAVFVDADGEQRQARMEVRTRREGLLWTRTLEATVEDCEALPEALALSIYTGLGALPTWSWETPSPTGRLRGSMGVRVSSTLPADFGFAFTGGLEIRALRSFGFWTRASLDSGFPVAVGQGTSTLTTVLLAAGPQLAPGPWRVWTGTSVGIGWARGADFPRNLTTRVPRVGAEAGVGRHLVGPLFVGLRAGRPLIRLLYSGPGGDRLESPLRIGIVIAIRTEEEKSSRGSEVERIGRASGVR